MRGVIRLVRRHYRRMPCGILFQFAENRRPLQIFAGGRVRRIDRLLPGLRVFFVDKLRYRNFREVGIAHKFGAIEKCPPEGLKRVMHRLGRAVAHFAEIIAFQNIQDLNEHCSARRWRRRADYFIPAIRPTHRLALFHFIVREILDGNQTAALLHCSGQFFREGTVIKIVWLLGNLLQRSRQVGLAENFARLVVISVALKHAMRFRKLGQMPVVQIGGLFPTQCIAFAR